MYILFIRRLCMQTHAVLLKHLSATTYRQGCTAVHVTVDAGILYRTMRKAASDTDGYLGGQARGRFSISSALRLVLVIHPSHAIGAIASVT